MFKCFERRSQDLAEKLMDNARPEHDLRGELREALVAAATRFIAENGYAALRARDLAAEVGCAVGSIYNAFPDIDAIILAVKTRTLDRLESELISRLGPFSPSSPDEALTRFLDLTHEYVDFANRNWRLWSQAFEHAAKPSVALDAYMLRLDGILTNIELPLGSLLPSAPAVERRLLTRALFGSVHGIVSLGLGGKLGSITLEQLQWQTRTLLAATLNGLRQDRI
jgi:AcrR family transcriptional regulator